MSGEKNNIRLVSSAEEAQLIVEVNGRRSSSSGATGGLLAVRDDQFYISFLMKAGPKLRAGGEPVGCRVGRLYYAPVE